jgi:hypothetical protein
MHFTHTKYLFSILPIYTKPEKLVAPPKLKSFNFFGLHVNRPLCLAKQCPYKAVDEMMVKHHFVCKIAVLGKLSYIASIHRTNCLPTSTSLVIKNRHTYRAYRHFGTAFSIISFVTSM